MLCTYLSLYSTQIYSEKRFYCNTNSKKEQIIFYSLADMDMDMTQLTDATAYLDHLLCYADASTSLIVPQHVEVNLLLQLTGLEFSVTPQKKAVIVITRIHCYLTSSKWILHSDSPCIMS